MIISLPLENLTSCSPIISPFLTELKFIFLLYGKVFLFKNLILLEGKHDKEALRKFNKILSSDIQLKNNILKVYFSENIGWKIFLRDSSCLYLPLEKIDKLISVYKKIKDSKIYNNFKYFDMRILERVYLNKENKCLTS